MTGLFHRRAVTVECSNAREAPARVCLLHSTHLFIHAVFSESLLYTQHKGSEMSLGLQENHAFQWAASQVPHTHCIPIPTPHEPPGVSATLPALTISAYGADLLELRRCPWPLPLTAATSSHSPSPAVLSTSDLVPPHPTRLPAPLVTHSVIRLATLSHLRGGFLTSVLMTPIFHGPPWGQGPHLTHPFYPSHLAGYLVYCGCSINICWAKEWVKYSLKVWCYSIPSYFCISFSLNLDCLSFFREHFFWLPGTHISGSVGRV